MSRIIKLSLVIALAIFANFSFAQRSPEEKTKMMVKKLTVKLALSGDQQQKLTDVFITHFNMMKDLHFQFKNADKHQSKTAFKEQWNRTDQQVIMVLNDSQRMKYNEEKMKIRKNRIAKNKQKGKGNSKNVKTKPNPEQEVDAEEPLDEEAF